MLNKKRNRLSEFTEKKLHYQKIYHHFYLTFVFLPVFSDVIHMNSQRLTSYCVVPYTAQILDNCLDHLLKLIISNKDNPLS